MVFNCRGLSIIVPTIKIPHCYVRITSWPSDLQHIHKSDINQRAYSLFFAAYIWAAVSDKPETLQKSDNTKFPLKTLHMIPDLFVRQDVKT